MQQMWTEIDNYIDAHLIPEDPILLQTLENTEKHGFPDHLAVAPNQGMLLQMLIQMNQCKRVLELGTFAAYSTMWLARALPEDGYILTIEGRDTHAAMGQENIDKAQLKQTMNSNVDVQQISLNHCLQTLNLSTLFLLMPINKATRSIWN